MLPIAIEVSGNWQITTNAPRPKMIISCAVMIVVVIPDTTGRTKNRSVVLPVAIKVSGNW